jgi:hypothetical protein
MLQHAGYESWMEKVYPVPQRRSLFFKLPNENGGRRASTVIS